MTLLPNSAERLAVVGNPDSGSQSDFYSFTLAAGQRADILVTGSSGYVPSVEIQDESGTVIATGLSDNASNQVVRGLYSASGGTFYIKLNGYSGYLYTLLVSRGTALVVEPNETDANAQRIGPTGKVLSYLGGSDTADRFSFVAAPGDVLDLRTAVPGAGSLGDGPRPQLELYNLLGELVAQDSTTAATSSNAHVQYTVPLGGGGAYTVRVIGTASGSTVSGVYTLTLTGATLRTSGPPRPSFRPLPRKPRPVPRRPRRSRSPSRSLCVWTASAPAT